MNKLNREEILYGILYSATFAYWMGLYSLLAIPLCSFLWAYSGWGASKLYRRLGVPLSIATAIFVNLGIGSVFIAVPFNFAVLSIGYGIPDINDPVGSQLGGFFHWISPNHADLLTRGTIYLLFVSIFLLAINPPSWFSLP